MEKHYNTAILFGFILSVLFMHPGHFYAIACMHHVDILCWLNWVLVGCYQVWILYFLRTGTGYRKCMVWASWLAFLLGNEDSGYIIFSLFLTLPPFTLLRFSFVHSFPLHTFHFKFSANIFLVLVLFSSVLLAFSPYHCRCFQFFVSHAYALSHVLLLLFSLLIIMMVLFPLNKA